MFADENERKLFVKCPMIKDVESLQKINVEQKDKKVSVDDNERKLFVQDK